MLHTAKPQSEGQSFHRRLLSEYNPDITLDNYVSYFELKPICNSIRSVRTDMEKRLGELQRTYLASAAAAAAKNNNNNHNHNHPHTNHKKLYINTNTNNNNNEEDGDHTNAGTKANPSSVKSAYSESSFLLTPTHLPPALVMAGLTSDSVNNNNNNNNSRDNSMASAKLPTLAAAAAKPETSPKRETSEMSFILAEEPSSPLCAQYYGHHDAQLDLLGRQPYAATPDLSTTSPAAVTPRHNNNNNNNNDNHHLNNGSSGQNRLEAAAAAQPTGPVSLYSIAQQDATLRALHARREALTEEFFLGIKKSYDKVAAYLLQMEKNLIASMDDLHKKNDTQIREKESKDYIPSIYIQVECITRYRQLNLLAFRMLFLKFLERCACDSLRLQQRVYQMDEVVAAGRISKSSIDLRGIAMQIIAVFGTVYRYTFEDTLLQLKIYAKKSHLCDERILPYSNTFFFGDTFSQQERQGHFAIRVLAGSMSTLSAKLITEVLQCNKFGGGAVCSQFANGEVNVHFKEAVRGDDVYIVQSMVQNEEISNATAIMELALMVHTAQLASAARIVAVIPYLAYTKNVASISALAEIIEAMGCHHVITVDMHSDQVEGMFAIPLESISAKYEFVRFISNQLQEEGHDFTNLSIIAPSGNFLGRAKDFADALMRYNHLDTTRQFVSVCTAVKRIAPRTNKKSTHSHPHDPTNTHHLCHCAGNISPTTSTAKETPTSITTPIFPAFNHASTTLPAPDVHTNNNNNNNGDGNSPTNQYDEAVADTAMQQVFPPSAALTPAPEPQPAQQSNNNSTTAPKQPTLRSSSSTLGMEKALEWQEQGACPISVRAEEKPNRPDNKEEYKNIVLVGEVRDKTCIIIDTVIDEAVNISLVAQQIKESGAARILLVATHAVFSGEAVARLVAAPIDVVITSDSVCQDWAMRDPALARKLRIVPIAPLLARAIEKIHTENTLSSLFEK